MAVVTVRIGPLGPFAAKKRPRPGRGLRYSQTFNKMNVRPDGRGSPSFGTTIWTAVWETVEDLDAYEETGSFMADAYALRLEPVRQYGTHVGLGLLANLEASDEGSGPYAVITTGVMTNMLNMPRFMKQQAAYAAVHASPSLLANAVGMSPPNKFQTLTLWRDLQGMREAVEAGHREAWAERDRKPFMATDRDAFIRLRPLSATGEWEGKDPLSGLM